MAVEEIPVYSFDPYFLNDTFEGMQFGIEEAGEYIDLTEADVLIQFKFATPSGKVWKELTVGNGLEIVLVNVAEEGEPENLKTFLEIESFSLVGWIAGAFISDVQITRNNIVRTYFKMILRITQDISQ